MQFCAANVNVISNSVNRLLYLYARFGLRREGTECWGVGVPHFLSVGGTEQLFLIL
jgi:hypothetical protein